MDAKLRCGERVAVDCGEAVSGCAGTTGRAVVGEVMYETALCAWSPSDERTAFRDVSGEVEGSPASWWDECGGEVVFLVADVSAQARCRSAMINDATCRSRDKCNRRV